MNEADRLLVEISEKMDKILRLLAIDTVKEMKTEQMKIELLNQLGFRPVDIATLLNKSQDNVNVQLNLIRKKKDRDAKRTEKEENSDDKKQK